MASNSLFTSKVTSSNFSKARVNREYLISGETADDFNKYASFGQFPLFSDVYDPKFIGDDYREDGSQPLIGQGIVSLFNRAGAVVVDSPDITKAGQLRLSTNTPLLDSNYNRDRIRSASKCTVKDLVRASQEGLLGRNIYSYADFMYCKNLGKMPNNYLITLRRFPAPVDDYISSTGIDSETRKSTVSKNSQSIGCMVTWLGTEGNSMSDILKYDVSMPFEYKNARWEQSDVDADANGGVFNAIANTFDSQYRKQYASGMVGSSVSEYFNKLGIHQGHNPYTASTIQNWRDENKVYGPIDAVKGLYMRSGEGIDFKQSFTLQFDYELRAYDGINTRQAMLDLLANILAVTYTTGTFWGGGRYGGGAHQNNIFANLEMFKCNGGFTDFVESFSKDVQTLSSHAVSGIKSAGGLIPAIKSALNALGGMLIGGALNSLGRPQKVMMNSLLSEAPTGLWHVTIGNPFHPIMSLGNMVITGTTIEHYGPLGLDDFPTGLRVKVTLERGKPRDLREIERIYMGGSERIFHSWGPKIVDMYNNATIIHRSGKNEVASTSGEVTKKDLDNGQNRLMKYFGETDDYSITFAAKEQAFGSSKMKRKESYNVV